jgi:hypothetical protein
MGTVNALNPSIDQTVQVFDRFYNYQQSVNAEEYDVVNSYLRSIFTTSAQAGNFTVTLFRIASLSDTPVMTLLQSLKGLSGPQITLYFAYYLNTLQSPSTMIGVQTPVLPNYYVAHNIKQ